jgi:hypothetical protein
MTVSETVQTHVLGMYRTKVVFLIYVYKFITESDIKNSFMIDPTVTLFCVKISVLKSGCMCQTIKCHQINKHLNCYPI